MKNNIRPTIARDYAFKFLYHTQLAIFKENDLFDIESLNEKLEIFYTSFLEQDVEHHDNSINNDTVKYAHELIKGILVNHQQLKEKIAQNSNNWPLARIDKIDLTVLLIGTFELIFLKSTPAKVAINEAINLVKKYGNKESYAFVNGILQSIWTSPPL